MGKVTFSTVEAERPMAGVAIVRLMEAPTISTGPAVVDAVLEAARGAELVVLTGPGWLSSAPAWETTVTIGRSLRAVGVEVSMPHAPELRPDADH